MLIFTNITFCLIVAQHPERDAIPLTQVSTANGDTDPSTKVSLPEGEPGPSTQVSLAVADTVSPTQVSLAARNAVPHTQVCLPEGEPGPSTQVSLVEGAPNPPTQVSLTAGDASPPLKSLWQPRTLSLPLTILRPMWIQAVPRKSVPLQIIKLTQESNPVNPPIHNHPPTTETQGE